MTSASAEIARRFDPDLHRAAMFTPEPMRSRLMVLIAFDVECARALRASDEIIAQMRLQWWQDRVQEALSGRSAEHEVAGPLSELIQAARGLDWDAGSYFFGWTRMLEGPFTAEAFDHWLSDRYAAWLSLTAQCCGVGGAECDKTALRAMGRAMSLAFALRQAGAMALEGNFLLPLAGLDRAALTRGEVTASAQNVIAGQVGAVNETLVEARRLKVSAGLKPILRLGWRIDATLRAASGPSIDLPGLTEAGGRSGTRILLIRSALGQW
ncbi:MAG: squalene/phytoene synthase family protein [Pseudomonadota bacterium]